MSRKVLRPIESVELPGQPVRGTVEQVFDVSLHQYLVWQPVRGLCEVPKHSRFTIPPPYPQINFDFLRPHEISNQFVVRVTIKALELQPPIASIVCRPMNQLIQFPDMSVDPDGAWAVMYMGTEIGGESRVANDRGPALRIKEELAMGGEQELAVDDTGNV
ncbi:uncharacterized protein AB675_11822 [Cyphellophora attinorum]|uniref:Uncharacterized protein n=1 Tax=Cyphellophora attinorum TaxID=1664694 RepID=A0A0N0NJC1_9EURO|nr:uncharacterized protein AB675_11822 [Phialophora attinorum]KPI36811.1 hypothetical protein AB675_11822 [Phialophora attinorum]